MSSGVLGASPQPCGLLDLYQHCDAINSVIIHHQKELSDGVVEDKTLLAYPYLSNLNDTLCALRMRLASAKQVCDEHGVCIDLSYPLRLSVDDVDLPKQQQTTAVKAVEGEAVLLEVDGSPNGRALGYILPHISKSLHHLEELLMLDSCATGPAVKAMSWQRETAESIHVESRKLEALISLVGPAMHTPMDSILMNRATDFILNSFEAQDSANAASLATNMRRFYSRLEKVKCVVHRCYRKKNKMLRILNYWSLSLYYFMRPRIAAHQSRVLSVSPDIDYLKFMWDLPNSGFIRLFNHVALPPIKHTFLVRISPDDVANAAQLPDGQPDVMARILSPRKLDIPKPMQRSFPSRVHRALCCPCLREADTLSISADESPPHFNLNRVWSADGAALSSPLPYEECTIVLHLHGGGFISGCSFYHQNYTRQWAMDGRLPVVSCDYRLAPESQFPAALQDAWLCYTWILQNAQQHLAITPRNIILAGDSAGGNLVCGITIRAIQEGYRVPDGLLLAYPALCVSARHFYPSYLECLDETMVPFGFLLSCMNAYCDEPERAANDPLISPAVASDDILQRFPPTRIMVGTKDPLLDQSVEFAQRLLTLGVDVALKIYPKFPHGFLSFDNPCRSIAHLASHASKPFNVEDVSSPLSTPSLVVGVRESHSCVRQSIEWLQELASLSHNRQR